MPVPALPQDLWVLNFVSDQLDSGRRFRILAIYDVCPRQCLAAIRSTHLNSETKRLDQDELLRTLACDLAALPRYRLHSRAWSAFA